MLGFSDVNLAHFEKNTQTMEGGMGLIFLNKR